MNYLENINAEVVLILKLTDKIDSRKKLIKKIKEVGEVKRIFQTLMRRKYQSIL